MGHDVAGGFTPWRQVGGVVPSIGEDAQGGWNPGAVLSTKDARKMDRFIPFALGAAQQALAQAGLEPAQIQHLNAHATSTCVGDRGELAAIRGLFGEGATVAIASTKGATGHLLGAAGAVASVFTVLALRDQVVPGTLNLHRPDELAQGLDPRGPPAPPDGAGARAGQRLRLRRRQRLAGASPMGDLSCYKNHSYMP